MDIELSVVHERVDDIPVIFGMARRLGLAAVLDKHLGRHGNHRGLSYGWLATTWIAYILAEGDHRKSAVEGWSQTHRGLLTLLTRQEIRETEFSDDRLGRLLSQLGDPETWQAIEKDLWQQTVLAYDLRCERVRLDSTTTYGFHETTPDGLMQLGHSKDHRPDKPQLKLMAAVAEPARQMLATDVYPGQTADDGLYVPMVERVRQITRKTGLLYIGDAKMAALATRAVIVGGGDHYLTRLPRSGDAAERDGWITAVTEDGQPTTAIVRDGQTLGEGYETARSLTHRGGSWTERVLIYQSTALAERQRTTFDERLGKAADALRALTPEPGPGRRQLCDQKAFLAAIARVEAKYRVAGLFWVKWHQEPHPSRKDPHRERFVVLDVIQRPEAIAAQRQRLGWQVLVTDVPADELPFADVVLAYNDGWIIEHQFHNIKDRPLGIRPLFVTRDDQDEVLSSSQLALGVSAGASTAFSFVPIDPAAVILLGVGRDLDRDAEAEGDIEEARAPPPPAHEQKLPQPEPRHRSSQIDACRSPGRCAFRRSRLVDGNSMMRFRWARTSAGGSHGAPGSSCPER